MKKIMGASVEQLVLCPGLGETKVRNLQNAFQSPFVSSPSKLKSNKGSTSELSKFIHPKDIPPPLNLDQRGEKNDVMEIEEVDEKETSDEKRGEKRKRTSLDDEDDVDKEVMLLDKV